MIVQLSMKFKNSQDLCTDFSDTFLKRYWQSINSLPEMDKNVLPPSVSLV